MVKAYRTGSLLVGTFPEFAVDASGDKYRDRLYVVWNDY
jgi:membrane-bound inhibitor of C-type lysozyme